MTAQELILLDKGKVRRDSNLMSLYLVYFKEAYNYVPSCAGCSFGTDWQKFVSFYTAKKEKTINEPKNIFMAITIKKIQGKILSYKKEGRTYRLYDNILNDAFISEYISNGSESELEERKKLFNFPVEEVKTILLIEDENGIKAFDEKENEKEVVFSENPIKKTSYEILAKDINSEFTESDIKLLTTDTGVIPSVSKKRGRKSKK